MTVTVSMRGTHCCTASLPICHVVRMAYLLGKETWRFESAFERRMIMLLWGFLARQIRRWHAYNRTVAELSQLDDRTLGDINVMRSEIRAIARRATLHVV
ncbi:DUF1127 domain-containing protein [Aquabacter sp. L1I39]|uniref:DUF1127 domain-containing protein n=1 Tax=Aquabacter sp. L1I39 TaxID=2820278 RepID=UPI001FFC3607|nr:DUF1127 domain-containing protein [Aquabacter sp. L1I39]